MKKILYTLMLCLISAFAFAQEPAPPSPAKPFTAQFYVSTTGGDTTIYIYKVVQGVVYGWTRLAKSSETNLFVGRTLKGDGTTDITALNVNMDSTATAINNFLLAKNANGDIVPINANFSTDNNTIIFNGIKINANAGIILNPSIESGKDYFLKTDSANHMIVRDTNRYVPKYLGADFHLYNIGHKLIIDSVLFGSPTKNVQIREGSANFDAPGGRSAAFSAKEFGFFNGLDTVYYFKAAASADTIRGVKELHYNRLFAMNAPVDTNEVANKKYVDSRPSTNLGNTDLTASATRIFNYDAYSITFGGLGKPSLYADATESKLYYNSNDFSNIIHSATVNSSGINLFSGTGFFQQSNILVRPEFVDISTSPVAGGSEIRLEKDSAIMIYTYQNGDGFSPGMRYTTNDYALAHLDSLWIPNWKSVKRYADSVSASGGGVTAVTGTTNRITSTGGTTPSIDISSTFEALLGKVANPLSQFASTTSAQLLGVISDESGTGALLFAGSPALTGTPTTPTATGATNTTQIASTAQVHLAIISDTTSNIQNRAGAQNQFSNLAGRIVTNTSNIATNTSNITANTTAIGLKQPRIVGNKPSATSTTYTTADSVTQVLSNLNSGIIANTASISAIPTYTASLGVSKVGNDFRSDTAYNQTVLNFFPKGDTRWLKTATAATTYVPYTGATTDVALGAHGIGANKLTLAGNASPSYAAGALYFDTGNDALTFFNSDSNIGLQVGREEWIQVVNSSGSSIANGSAVYINSSIGGIPTIALAQANSGTTTICAGLTTETIANGATGYVTTLGVVHTLNTNAFVVGPIYLSATTPGAITQTIPSAPNYRYRIGFVTAVSATVGSIFITPSTASLGNGTANQLFGMNTGGTAQEVKSIVGSAATGQVVTNATNSITLSNDTTVLMPKANTKTLAQLQTAFNLKLNISDTAAMAYVHKAINETITGLKTAQFNNIASTITPGFVIANNQVLTTGQAQLSPALKLSAPAFGTTLGTSQPVDWYIYSSGIAGTTPTGQLVFSSGVGAATPGARVSFNTNASITAAGGNSVFTNNRTGIAATTTSGIISTNSTASTSGVAEQRAPAFEWNGHVWNTTATAADNVFGGRIDVRGISGTTPDEKMFFQTGKGVSSVTYTDKMSLNNSGDLAMLTGTIILKSFTVATLPTGVQGMIAYVTDALTPASLAVVVGGGASVVPVFYNGTNWVVQ